MGRLGERSSRFVVALRDRPVIAGLKKGADIQRAAAKGVRVCFYLTGTIFELRKMVSVSRSNNMLLLAHVDLIQGVAKDSCGVQFLAEEIGIDGILTTKGQLVRAARRWGLLSVQRLFILDSEALRTGAGLLRNSEPDAVEILPGLILPQIFDRLPQCFPPIIAGGLIETSLQLEQVLGVPVLGASTSNCELWGKSNE